MPVYNIKKEETNRIANYPSTVEKFLTDEQDLILGELTYFRNYYLRSIWL